jgi:hypothetical protein
MKMIAFGLLLLLIFASIANVAVGQTQGSGPGNCWIIFASSVRYNGNLGGAVGADAKCEFFSFIFIHKF